MGRASRERVKGREKEDPLKTNSHNREGNRRKLLKYVLPPLGHYVPVLLQPGVL